MDDGYHEAEPYTGPDFGGAGVDEPGGLLRAMQDAGIDIRQTGAARGLLSAGRQSQFGGTLSNDMLVNATHGGLDLRDMARGRFTGGRWTDAAGNPLRGRGDPFKHPGRG